MSNVAQVLSQWLLLTLGLTGLFLILLLKGFPFLITAILVRRFGGGIRGTPWNQLLWRTGTIRAGDDAIPVSSPDVCYLLGLYDTTKEAVRLRCRVPDWECYWSVSLYALDTTSFFVLSKGEAAGGELRLVIARRGFLLGPNCTDTVITSPTRRGVIIVRASLSDPENSEEVEGTRAWLNHTRISLDSEDVEREPILCSAPPTLWKYREQS